MKVVLKPEIKVDQIVIDFPKYEDRSRYPSKRSASVRVVGRLENKSFDQVIDEERVVSIRVFAPSKFFEVMEEMLEDYMTEVDPDNFENS